MWPFTNKDKAIDKDVNLALENLYQYWGADLPILNEDAYNYINKAWKNIGVVYNCTDIIFKKVVKCPIVFYKVKDKKAQKRYESMTNKASVQALITKAQAYDEVSIPALEKLLEQPNAQQNYQNFIGVLLISYLVTGNSFVYSFNSAITKKPSELWAFPELKINSGGMYNPIKSYTQFFGADNEKNYPAETIYHIKTPNPEFNLMGSQLYGVSPLRAFLEPLRTIDEANKQASKQMANGGVLNLLSPIHKEDNLTAEQRSSFMNKFKDALRSGKGMDRYLTSSIQMDIKRIGLPSAELELLTTKSANEESIYRLYGIPLARYSQASSTMSNQKESNAQLITDAIAPVADVISHMLTKFVGVHFDNTVIELDYTQLEELSANIKEVVDYLIPLIKAGVISRDEARFALKYGETGIDYMKDYLYDDKPLKNIYNNGGL